jgi:hypothetical protein
MVVNMQEMESLSKKLDKLTHHDLKVQIYKMNYILKRYRAEKLTWKRQLKELVIVNHRLDREIKKYKKREGERLARGLLQFGAEHEGI